MSAHNDRIIAELQAERRRAAARETSVAPRVAPQRRTVETNDRPVSDIMGDVMHLLGEEGPPARTHSPAFNKKPLPPKVTAPPAHPTPAKIATPAKPSIVAAVMDTVVSIEAQRKEKPVSRVVTAAAKTAQRPAQPAVPQRKRGGGIFMSMIVGLNVGVTIFVIALVLRMLNHGFRL